MATPWLDALSEDWEAEARSSPEGSLPRGSPSASVRRLAQDSSLVQHHDSPSEPVRQQENTTSPPRYVPSIPRSHRNTSSKSLKQSLNGHSTMSSNESVVIHFDKVERKSRSSSPPKNRNGPESSTPDWKKLLMKGPGALNIQQDLFSPIGLEGIFQQPEDDGTGTLARKIPKLSFMQKYENLSSSPPSGPKMDKTTSVRFADFPTIREAPKPLSDWEEEDESEQQESQEGYDDSLEEDGIPRNDSSMGSSPNRTPACDMSSASPSLNGYARPANDKSSQSEPVSPTERTTGKTQPASTQGTMRSVISHDGTSAASAFSPVMISKYNTADGETEYAPLSMDSRLNAQYDPKAQVEVDGSVISSPQAQAEADHSMDQSSLLPSDSMSQIYVFRHNETAPQPLMTSTAAQIATNGRAKSVGLSDQSPHTPEQAQSSQANRKTAPASASPLKLFANNDTWTNGRLLDRMTKLRGAPEDHKEQDQTTTKSSPSRRTRKGDFSFRTPLPETLSTPHLPEGTLRNSPVRSRSPLKTAMTPSGTIPLDTRPTTPEAHDDNDPFITKRGPSPPSKHPTPKRQRTLHPMEMAIGGQSMADVVGDEHRRMQATTEAATVGSETPPMATATTHFATDGFDGTPVVEFNYNAAEGEQFSVLQSRIEEAEVSAEVEDPGTVKALATGLARFQLKSIANLKDSARKPSVSTQDYLNEAMKIMDIIRTARPAPHSELTGLEEKDFIPSDDSQEHSTLAPQQVSRPPSRVGMASVWRTRNDNELDPRVVSRLEKYAENGDDSHMMSSLMKSMRISQPEKVPAEHDNGIRTVETDLPNIRISGPRAAGGHRVTSSGAHSTSQGHSRVQSLEDSAASTSKTVTTDTSGRAKSVPTISPGKVSHLISSIEDAAGMRYDRERQAWIKDKAARRRAKSGEPSSSTGTEDPFEQISDLSTHSVEDQSSGAIVQDSRTGSASTAPSLSQFPLPGRRGISQPDAAASREPTVEVHPERRRVPPLSNLDVLYEESVLVDDSEHLIEEAGHEMDELDYSTEVENLPPTPDRFAKVPDGTIRSKRRDVSVMFSSPPVSRQWDPAAYERASSGSQVDIDEPIEISASTHGRAQQPPSAPSNDLRRQALRNISTAQANRMLSLAKRDDFREMSIVEQRPDGRTLSMTLSVATPRQLQRQAVSAALDAQNKDSSELLQSLSPLSEYTMHRDNIRHLEKRSLMPSTNATQSLHQQSGTAVVVTKLVEKLTDIEPEEPYWDEMQNLDLSNKSISDLHMLDHFCPEIESLDVSSNQLQQLGGIPQYVRQLSVRNNSLTNLTTWVQLQHLQYLDISGNGLDSLDGLCDLLHLRELRADNNRLASLDGVFDLDSLLDLSVKNNKLAMVDFQTADMKRLERLDLSGNELADVRGLDSLPALTHLDLSNNILQKFSPSDAQPVTTLMSLVLSHNHLDAIDLTSVPNLQAVRLDGNKLSRLPIVHSRHTISTLSMRDEAPASAFDLASSDLKLFSDLAHLDLSGTLLSAFPIDTPFLNLHSLGLALTGLQTLPGTFGKLAPNIRDLNLNLNAIKDLRPLRGIAKLKRLYVAGNRLSRLRRTMDVVHLLAAGGNLTSVDLRDNPVSVGIYGSVATPAFQASITTMPQPHSTSATATIEERTTSYLLPSGNAKLDRMYNDRLDEDTKLRRRVYELLLATKCAQLEHVDGLEWSTGRKEEVLRKDVTWQRLREMGVVAEKS